MLSKLRESNFVMMRGTYCFCSTDGLFAEWPRNGSFEVVITFIGGNKSTLYVSCMYLVGTTRILDYRKAVEFGLRCRTLTLKGSAKTSEFNVAHTNRSTFPRIIFL